MQISINNESTETNSTFLSRVATFYLERVKGEIPQSIVVFPNKRSGTFFLRELKSKMNTGGWMPQIVTLEDLVFRNTNMVPAIKYDLILSLYEIFSKIDRREEGFEDFFFWGEMLLGDFEDIDQHLVNYKNLFQNLEKLKEIESIDYLTDEQKKLIERFWRSLSLSKNKESWLSFWTNLKLIFEEFRNELIKKGKGYKGLIYRNHLENIEQEHYSNGYILFAGFNALTKAEEKLIKYYLQAGNADIIWDFDEYYMNDSHEAGRFLWNYKVDSVFEPYFSSTKESKIENNKNIVEISTSTWTAQTKVAGKLISELQRNENWKEENTAIILPDENLLINLLNALPSLSAINITMGLPIVYTNAYSLIENILRVHKNVKEVNGIRRFYHKTIRSLLKHPLLYKNYKTVVDNALFRIQKNNLINVSIEETEITEPVLLGIFEQTENYPTFLKSVLGDLMGLTENKLDRIYINAFIHHIGQLSESLQEYGMVMKLEALRKLLKQMARNAKIPFEGEPLKGIQIMGLMESRNLDFDNIIVLSLNEGHLPKNLRSNSFIPFGIRKAFEMPVRDDNDALQSYLFYRLFHNVSNAFLLYNTIGEQVGGEKSRYLYQLEYELSNNYSKVAADEKIGLSNAKPISIKRDHHIEEILKRFTIKGDGEKMFSPSAINTYLDCKLKFYFSRISGLYELKQISDEVDSRSYGTLFHKVMENIYRGKPHVDTNFIDTAIDKLDDIINQSFSEERVPGFLHGQFEGKNLVVKGAIREMALRILGFDKQYTPFDVLGTEYKEKTTLLRIPVNVKGKEVTVNIGSIIDRVDRKDNVVRVIDYKTGSDMMRFNSIPELFEYQGEKRNKAVFQVLLYSLIAKEEFNATDKIIKPLIMSTKEVFKSTNPEKLLPSQKEPKRLIEDFNLIKEEFYSHFRNLIEEIMNTSIFDQTDDEDTCKYCPYNKICHRYN